MSKSSRLWWSKPPVIFTYAVAVVSVSAALIIARVLQMYFEPAPASLFLCAVMFSAWFGGFRPGLLATVLSVVSLNYYFAPPLYSMAVELREIPRLVIFSLAAVLVGSLSAAQKRAEEKMRQAERELRATIDTIPTLAWHARPDGSVEYHNRRWLHYTGLTADDALDWDWKVAIHPEDLATLTNTWRSIFAAGTPGDVEARLRRFDGEYRWFLFRAEPLRDELGKIVRWYGANTDIEDRRRAEEALHHAQAELAHVARVTALGELAASIAHEVNQPLAAIVADANACLNWLAAERPDLNNVRESLAAIVSDGDRAGQVVARIRALLSRSSAGRRPCDLEGVIAGVLPLIRPALARPGIILETSLATDLPQVMGDPIELQQVLLNLLLNAAEASKGVAPERRRVVVRSMVEQREDGPWAFVAVEDAGVGISTADAARLFEAFYTTKPDGLGMGLSISRSIIERHGGRMWATGNAHYGATFSFALPGVAMNAQPLSSGARTPSS
jgi:PAS domain S-box-containing protein